MKKRVILTIAILFTLLSPLPNIFAQQTSQFDLPAGASARLGKGWVKDIAFSPNGAQLAVGTTIGVWIYDVSTGKEKDLLKGLMGGSNAIAYSPRDDILAAAHEDRTIRLWGNVSEGASRVISTFQGHTGHIHSIAFSENGQMIASGAADKTIRIWNVHDRKLHLILPGYNAPISTVAFSSDSSMIAGGSTNGKIRVWDTGTGEEIYEFNGHTEPISGLIFLAGDMILVSSSLGGEVQLWNLVAPGEQLLPPREYGVSVHAVAAVSDRASSDSDEYIFATGTADKLIRVWNMRINQQTASFGQNTDSILDKHTDSVRNVKLSPDGRTLASASLDGTVQLWDWRSRRLRLTLKAHTGKVKALAYTTDNRIRACGTGLDGKLRLWDAGTGVVLSVMQEHTGLTETAAFSWDGNTLASAGLEDSKIFLSDVETALVNDGSWGNSSLQGTLTGNSDGITALAFSPAGTMLASGGLDGKIHLLDIATRRELEVSRGPESTVTALRFAIDGTFLASGEENSTLRYWNSLTGEETAKFQVIVKPIINYTLL